MHIFVLQRGCIAHFCADDMLKIVKNINHDTGEIYSDKRTLIEDVLTDDGYKVPSHKLGAKLFADVSYPEDMTDSEIGKMARLAKLMVATANMLGYRTGRGIKPYSETQLIDILKMSRFRGREFIAKMISLGVMQKNTRIVGDVESEEYYINPAYFFAGRRISLNLYLLFREQLDPILPEWVRLEFWRATMEQVKAR